MTGLSFLLVANGLPFLPIGPFIGQQARAAVDQGLWINALTLEVGVSWEAA